MKKTECQLAGAIRDAAKQTPPSPVYDLREFDFAFDHHPFTRTQAAHGAEPGTVFVADGKQEQQICWGIDAKPRQTLCHGRAYAFKRFQIPGRGFSFGACP